jgi:hypothetical protein
MASKVSFAFNRDFLEACFLTLLILSSFDALRLLMGL